MKRDLLLLIVAYHSPLQEVEALKTCLTSLPMNIGYSLVVNDYKPGQSIEILFDDADYTIRNSSNNGYGKAVNQLLEALDYCPKYIGILNTDITWKSNTFEPIISYLDGNNDVHLVVPQIVSASGQPEKLCKQNPTFLGLLSRRFIPCNLKPSWLKKYDSWYTMGHYDYSTIFEVPYLSGCCMVTRLRSLLEINGFDERYFLYLEDADLTRSLSRLGRCIHFPHVQVTHSWGKGNYRSLRLMLVNIVSAYKYFVKWGLSLW